MFLEEGGSEVFQIFDKTIVRLRPVHGEVKAVFIACGGIGKVARISAIGDHKQLQIFIQRMLTVKALFTVSVYLVERLTDSNTPLFHFALNQRQAVDPTRYIVTLSMGTGLFELLNQLNFVAGDVLLIDQLDVFDMLFINHNVMVVVIVLLAGFLLDHIARFIVPFIIT